MTAARSEAFYADVRGGRRFCLVHRPNHRARPRGTLVHIHAFAEEMNKSRRAVALAARALAADGWAVLQMDLAGCGDSSGEFGGATWRDWIEDAVFAHQWASEHCGGPSWLWGLRAGCLIAAAAGARLGGQVPLLLWQPVLSGPQHLTQFLRLRVANQALGASDDRSGTKALRIRLAAGDSLEIAGYVLNPLLADGLEQSHLRLEEQHAQVIWLEVLNQPAPSLTPAAAARIGDVTSRGVAIDAAAVPGPPFWHTIEIAECSTLVDATLAALGRSAVHGL